MVHPILETLFFLKIARQSVCESIMASNVQKKSELVNYIRNEASDYEVMHLVTLGEMPSEKFDYASEQAVWHIFKEMVIMNTESLRKDMLKEDIMNIIYEMGPVSNLGYSSAAPILEFDKSNGRLNESYLNMLNEAESRFEWGGKPKEKTLKQKAEDTYSSAKKVATDATNTAKKAVTNAATTATNAASSAKDRVVALGNTGSSSSTKEKAASILKNVKADPTAAAGVAAAGAVGVAGLYGLYKLYKAWKNKKATAKTPAAKAAADKGMASVKAKIAAKKKK